MTKIDEWLAEQKAELDAMQRMKKEYHTYCDDASWIEHERAIKILEKYREALLRSGHALANAVHWTTAYSKGYVDQEVKAANEALSYFPEVDDETK